MKHLTITSLINMTLIGITALAISACNDQPSQVQVASPEPQVIVVTATPAVEFRIETKPSEVADQVEPTPAPLEAGALLKGSGEGVFYLTEAGTRRHIYDWDTFEAFGFAKQDIIEVEDTVLADIPLGQPLTRLVWENEDELAWVSDGQRYQVYQPEQWSTGPAQMRGFGMPATELDPALVTALPKRAGFGQDTFLRNHSDVYFYDLKSNTIMRADAKMVEQLIAVGSLPEKNLLEVPLGLLAGYEETEVKWMGGELNAETGAANLRSGPGLADEVVGVVPGKQQFQIKGHTVGGDWLLVDFEELTGWLAADLVREAESARLLLPVIEATEVASNTSTDLPQAEPAAMSESVGAEANPQPVYCNEVPIRGFGQVWGDHPEVQQTLSCPAWPYEEQGTNAAVQPFQHGLMLWLEADSGSAGDPVYVFFNDGSYQRFGDLGPADPAKVQAIPNGFFAVGDKFSKVYWEGTGAQVKERLGYPTALAEESAGAYQQFYNGRMFWAETADQIYIIYDYSVYDAATERSVRIRTWESYEDKF